MKTIEKMAEVIRDIANGRMGHAGHAVYDPRIFIKKRIDDILQAYESEKDEYVRVRKDRLEIALSGDCPHWHGGKVTEYCKKYDMDCAKCIKAFLLGKD